MLLAVWAMRRSTASMTSPGSPSRRPDLDEADVLPHEAFAFALDVEDVEIHEALDLVAGALPVLEGERIEREDFDADRRGFLDDGADGGGAVAVPEDSREAALLSPAAVAVHDDGDVPGDALGVDIGRRPSGSALGE